MKNNDLENYTPYSQFFTKTKVLLSHEMPMMLPVSVKEEVRTLDRKIQSL